MCSAGKGGALIVNDPRYVERAEVILEKGTDRVRFFRGEIDKYTWQDIGSSYVLSELNAAFLLAQQTPTGCCACRYSLVSRMLLASPRP
jgi:dTDP-4-amino-4,6-dideoxygalactose transaminase